MRGVSVLCAPWGLRGNSSESRQSTTFSEERTIRREMRLRPRFLSYTVIHDYDSYAIDRPLILVGLRKKKKKKRKKNTRFYTQTLRRYGKFGARVGSRPMQDGQLVTASGSD